MTTEAEGRKTCSACGITKPLDSFVKNRHRPGGRGSPCIVCWRRNDALRHRAKFQNDASHRQASNKARSLRRKPYKRDPVKNKARLALAHAVQRGEIIRPSACEKCGTTCQPHGHHEDYSKPLDVQWLCKDCHAKVHRIYQDNL